MQVLRQYEDARNPPNEQVFYEKNGEVELEHSYFPEGIFRNQIHQLEDDLNEFQPEEAGEIMLPDGGDGQYYWKGSDGVLYHTEPDTPHVVDPFMPTIKGAEDVLDNMADRHGWEHYSDMALYKAKQNGHYQIEEATEVRTEQQGLTDF